MKRLNILFTLILLSTLSYGQKWDNVSNSLQRKIVGPDTLYRINMGAPGFWNISDAINRARTSGVTLFNNRTGSVTPLVTDYSAFFPVLTGSYVNPSWITSLPWSKITDTPNFRDSLSATSPIFYNSSTGVISSQAAGAGIAGYVTSGVQTFSGLKTFSSDLTLSNSAALRMMNGSIEFHNSTTGFTNYVNGIFSTAGRSWTFPDASGTIALTSDIPTSLPTPNTLTAGYGLSGNSFNGSVARTFTADTTSATGLVSKPKLASFAYTKAQADALLANKVDANTAITVATKAKITYDSKGLVTAGSDLTASDIPFLAISKTTNLQDSLTNKYSKSDANVAFIKNQTAISQTAGFNINGFGTAGGVNIKNSGTSRLFYYNGSTLEWAIGTQNGDATQNFSIKNYADSTANIPFAIDRVTSEIKSVNTRDTSTYYQIKNISNTEKSRVGYLFSGTDPDYRYGLLTYNPPNYTGVNGWADRVVFQSGGHVEKGMLLYADYGAIQLSIAKGEDAATKFNFPNLYITPHESTYPGKVVIADTTSYGAAFRVNGDMRLDTLANGSNSDSLVVWNATTKRLNKVLQKTIVTSVAGTANQILVNGGTTPESGAITLTLPQNIGTSSNVQFGAGTFSGKITSVLGNDNAILENTSASTGWQAGLRLVSSGANIGVGIENSTGGNRYTNSTPYAAYVASYTTAPLEFATNNIRAVSINSSQVATFAASPILSATPTTSASAYTILTRNSTTGAVEKVPISQTVAGDDFNPVTSDAVNVALATKADASSVPTLASGPFTPTNTNVGNISSSSPLAFTYDRVGGVVSFTYAFSVTASGAGSCTMDFTLPISSDFTNAYDLIATASGGITSPGLTANITDDKGRLSFTVSGAGTYNITVSGHYKIL